MENDLKEMMLLRIKVAEHLQHELKSNLLVQEDDNLQAWLHRIIDDLEIGKLRPMQAYHAYLRKKTQSYRDRLWESQQNTIPFLSDWTGGNSFPPRPRQTRLGIRAAAWARMTTLFGPSDTGKTTCAVRALQLIASRGPVDGFISVTGERLGMMSTSEMLALMDTCVKSEIMLIDDIDKAITGTSGKKSSFILEILKIREMGAYKRTIVTTNKAGGELVDQIEQFNEGCGLPIVNRLRRGICIDFGPEVIDEDAEDNAIRKRISKWKNGYGEESDDFDNEYGFLTWRAQL